MYRQSHQTVEYYLRRQLALAEILRHQTILEVAEPSALGEVVLGQEHVPQAEGAGLGLEVLQNDGVGLPSLLALTELGLECGFGGDTVFLDELFDLDVKYPVSEVMGFQRCGHTRSRVFLARSLTKGWAIWGIREEADMVIEFKGSDQWRQRNMGWGEGREKDK